MPQIEHNGPGFRYEVEYWRDIPGIQDNVDKLSVTDWRKNSVQVDNLPTYQRYKIRVIATNEKGQSNAQINEVIGYSGEDGNSLTKSFHY